MLHYFHQHLQHIAQWFDVLADGIVELLHIVIYRHELQVVHVHY